MKRARRAYVIFVGFVVYYAGFAALVFLMLFRLVVRKWREDSRTGMFNPERLRALLFNLREMAFVFGCPALIVLGFRFPSDHRIERVLFDWTKIPGIHVPRWQMLLLVVAVCLHLAARWEREVCLAHTAVYRMRFGATIKARRTLLRNLAGSFHIDYVERIAKYYEVCWAPGRIKGWPEPRWRAEWYTKGKPGAHPIYDIWKCGSGYAANIIRGSYQGRGVHLFDYHYCREVAIRWGAGIFDFVTERSPRDCTVAAVELPGTLPALSIYPKTVWDELAKRGGGIDVEMEGIEFSDAYRVWAQDRRFAFAVCNAQMMQFLSGHPGLALRISGSILALRVPGLVPVDDMVQFRDRLIEAHNLVPEFVFTDPGFVRDPESSTLDAENPT